MATINILDSSIFNRISAGEVVERPASAVKELVENSIDAGANMICVSIESGGIKNITVTDNGIGIDRDNIKKAFLPHATSKVASIEDLDKISTLGFRGEALASIASVAMVTVKSKTADSDAGMMLSVNGGVFGEITECGINNGTVIEVNNLFYNTPARAKFLKKPKSEENDITSLMAQFIMANPEVSFRYMADGKTIYQSSGQSFEDAVYAVYNREIVNKLIYFSENIHGYSVSGYVGSPELTKATRSYQTTIVNGRFVKDTTVSTAVTNAYGDTLMKRTFPVFIINLLVPFDDVDVNVHPAKTEVRFRDTRQVFSVVFHAVKNALERGKTIFELNFAQPIIADESNKTDSSNNREEKFTEKNNDTANDLTNNKPLFESNNQDIIPRFVDNVEFNSDNSESDRIADDYKKEEVKDLGRSDDKSRVTFEELTGVANIFTDNKSLIRDNKLYTVKESPSPAKLSGARPIQSKLFDDIEELLNNDYRIIGQIFNAYLIVEYKNELLLLDQHACHERLLYDKLIEEIDNNKVVVQPLLIPFILRVSPEEDTFLRENMAAIVKTGISIEEFRTYEYRIDSVPVVLGSINLTEFFKEFFADKNRYRQIKISELINDKIAQTACKAAIKAGSELSDEQIKMLINIFNESTIPVQCPHGRPAIIRITRKDVDKLFKRIV